MVKVPAEATLALLLFSDAPRVGLHQLRADLGLCVRLLGAGNFPLIWHAATSAEEEQASSGPGAAWRARRASCSRTSGRRELPQALVTSGDRRGSP